MAAAICLVCTTFTTAAAEASACDWVVSDVPVPSGHDPKFTTVRGTDSNGNYSGSARREGTGFTFDAVIWTGGQPRVLQVPGSDLTELQVFGENRSGTVLLYGRFPDRTATLVYKDAHEASGRVVELPGLEGYQINPATAINERGDVLGNATRASDGDSVGLLWRATGGVPQVIERAAGLPQDLDDDGTVLLRHPSGNGGRLWRDGVVTELAHEGKRQYVQAIRGGKVVGFQFEHEFSGPQGLLWDGNGAINRIAGAASAYAINGGGLVTGQRGSLTGKAAIWRDTRFKTELPLPNGVSGVSELFVVGDDDSLFSKSGSGPLRWSCD
ncbi:hypothetical protein ACFWN2_21540 [Lentzea sp. NPDC058436]|uniref:hypothetical protein n=1 Tax=Lentzea sp. NPDC058436 TaxID=3346499 RepID=UPI00365D1700